MTDQAQRTQWALQLFAGLVTGWTPSAMPPQLRDAVVQVQRAITAIAPPMKQPIAWLSAQKGTYDELGYSTSR